jgi:hypothetical protein
MHAANVRSFRAGGIPAELECRAEQSLGEDGRIDLRFDGPELTLLVENKLYSGYGHEQVRRYLRAVRRLPSGTRSALIAVTRAVPTCGEPALDEDDRWLGSVRWAQLLPQLHKLPIADRQLAAQWRLFFDVLDEQGDLGMTRADAELIRAWARYLEGRNHLEDLLDQIWEAERRVKTGDDALAAADRELTSHGFSAGRRHDRWVRTHEPEEYLEADDVPTRLIELRTCPSSFAAASSDTMSSSGESASADYSAPKGSHSHAIDVLVFILAAFIVLPLTLGFALRSSEERPGLRGQRWLRS